MESREGHELLFTYYGLKKVDVTGEQLPQRGRDETLSRTSPQLFERIQAPGDHGRERGSMLVLHIQGAGK